MQRELKKQCGLRAYASDIQMIKEKYGTLQKFFDLVIEREKKDDKKDRDVIKEIRAIVGKQ